MSRLSILDHLQEKSLGLLRVDEFAPPFFAGSCKETGSTRWGTDASEEFCLQTTLSVTFWANRAQHQSAREVAERALVRRLYADMLGELSELRLQISNGNRMACLEACDRIESKIT